MGAKDQVLARLRRHIARIEGSDRGVSALPASGRRPGPDSLRQEAPAAKQAAPAGGAPGVVPLDVAEIDRRLPGGGLQTGRLHEVVGALEGAGTGFAVHVLRRLMALERRATASPGGPVFWCAPQDTLYAPGLACRGMDVDRLVMVVAPRKADRLWAMEESLRCPGVLAAVCELQGRETVDLTASRRLQLAAGQGGAMALLLRPPPPAARQTAPEEEKEEDTPDGAVFGASAAVTRWSVHPLASGSAAGDDDMGRRSSWRLVLTRSRTGARHGWTVEVDHATGDFTLASPLRDRSGASDDRWAVA